MPIMTPESRSSAKMKVALCACFLLLFFCGALPCLSQEVWPQRGFMPGGAYSVSDFESVNTTNGNLILNFPLAMLPKGRAGLSAGITLSYNSKLYDTEVEDTFDHSGQMTAQNFLHPSEAGGWHYGTNYEVEVVNRHSDSMGYTCRDSGGTIILSSAYIWKVYLIMPDGGRREFRPTNYTLQDEGYYGVRPSGQISTCLGGGQVSGSMVYYSTDGSYTRLVFEPGSESAWTLSMPDGSRVVSAAGQPQKIYDRNNNYVSIGGTVSDQFGRSVWIEQVSPTEDRIHSAGFGPNEQLTWTVRWKYISVLRTYETTGASGGIGRGGTSTQTWQMEWRVVDRITLPAQAGGLSYVFGYDDDTQPAPGGWGELNSVTMPSGAIVHYTYELEDGPFSMRPSTKEVLRNNVSTKTLEYQAEYDGSSSAVTEQWQYSVGSSGSSVVGPDGATTTQWFGSTATENSMSGLVFKTVGPDGSVVERVWQHNFPSNAHQGYNINPYVKTEFVSVTNAAGQLTWTAIKDYDFDKNGNMTRVAEYDWVPYGDYHNANGTLNGAALPSSKLKRTTYNTYYNPTPDASTAANSSFAYQNASAPLLRGAVASTEIRSAANQTAARTEYLYDDPATTGNMTKQMAWDSTKGSCCSGTPPLTPSNSVSTTNQYDSFGNLTLTTDARNVQTQFVYGPVGGVSNLYPTETRMAYGSPVQLTTLTEYDFNTGLVTRTTDADNNVSTTSGYDPLGRQTLVTRAAGRPEETRTVTAFDDAGRRVVVRADLDTVGDGKLVTVHHFDQLGRIRLTRRLESASPAAETDEMIGIKVQTRYRYGNATTDPFNYTLTSNAYRAARSDLASGEPEMGWARTKSDSHGLTDEMESFSGAALPAPWGPNAASTGRAVSFSDAEYTTVTDQDGRVRRSKTNALGQVVRVDEPDGSGALDLQDGSPARPTAYTFDTLGNLTQVRQGGLLQAGNYQGGQTRTFSYTSLSRLASSASPEGGTFLFEYDDAGNIKKKIDPRLHPSNAAAHVETTYDYDELGRLKSRSYNDETQTSPGTPDVTYSYDDPAVAFSRGRLTKVTSTASETKYTTYDAHGRVTGHTQSTRGVDYPFVYKYNLAGLVYWETYPSGRVVKTDYSAAGQVAAVYQRLDAGAVKNYATNFDYSPGGAIRALKLGNDLFEHTAFNSRLQPIEIGLGTSAADSGKLKLEYGYGTSNNNGNLRSQKITAAGLSLTQAYTYDPLNRLETASETNGAAQESWKQKYVYDALGNRRIDPNPAVTSPDLVGPNPDISPTTNRISTQGYVYDDAGDLTSVPNGNGSDTYAYDAEGRMSIYNGGPAPNAGASYAYDGDGHRVKKLVGALTTVYVYDFRGKLVAEYTDDSIQTNGTQYLTSDPLGSPRVVTDSQQQVTARHDFHPFGEEVGLRGGRTGDVDPATGGIGQRYLSGALRQKFTGKERDTETGLDFFGARYHAPLQGRFTSPDPLLTSGALDNPQSWNRYAYTANNPLKYTDPLGLFIWSDALGGDKTNEELDAEANAITDRKARKKRLKEVDNIKKTRQLFLDKLAEARQKANNPGLTASQRDSVNRALGAYGNFKDGKTDNVIVDVTKKGGPATAFSEDMQHVVVTVNLKQSNRDPLITLAHEGSHVADHQDYIQHSAEPNARDDYDIPLWETESRAYFVSSYMAQLLNKDSYYPGAEKKLQVWNKGWKKSARMEMKRVVGVHSYVWENYRNSGISKGITEFPKVRL